MSDFISRLRDMFNFEFKIGDEVAYMNENGDVLGVPFIVESYDFFGGIKGTSVYGAVYAECKKMKGYTLKKIGRHLVNGEQENRCCHRCGVKMEEENE